MSFVAKKKEEECELHGAGGVVHRQVLGWVAISRKKCCTRSSEHDRQGTLTPLALGVSGSKRGSWWLGALLLRASNLASRSSIRTFSMTEICADFAAILLNLITLVQFLRII